MNPLNNKPNRHEQLIKQLDKFTEFLEPYKLLLRTHNVQFLVDNFWDNEKIFTKDLKDSISDFIDKATAESSDNTINLIKQFRDFTKQECEINNGFKNIFTEVSNMSQAWNEQVLTPLDSLLKSKTSRFEAAFEKIKKQNRFMNKKKVHEVDIMSKFVAELCEEQGIETVIIL